MREHKLGAVGLSNEGTLSVATLAGELGIRVGQLHKLRRDVTRDSLAASPVEARLPTSSETTDFKPVSSKRGDGEQTTMTSTMASPRYRVTYVATREGWLYLAVVLDVVSRREIGWLMDTMIERKLVVT